MVTLFASGGSYITVGVILIIIAVVVFFYFRTIKKTAKLILNTYLGVRYDDDNTLYYFKNTDFENLEVEEFTFKSNGLDLMGYKYYSSVVEPNNKMIIFFHGLGAGHIQYTTEIDYYAKKGYIVYTFDGQGCYKSKGEGLFYFTNFIKNGDDFVKYLEVSRDYKSKEVIFMGHSLGAHTAMVLSTFYKDKVSKVVSFAPFENIEVLLKDQLSVTLGKLANKLTREMAKLELANSQKYYQFVSKAILQTDIDTLIVYGDKDYVLNYDNNYNYFKSSLDQKENKYFVTVKDRTHRPNLTLKATEYDNYRNVEFDKIKRTASPEEFQEYYRGLDYKLLVEMDSKVMDLVDNFLDGKYPESKEIVLE